MVHLVPFQRSDSVNGGNPEGGENASPTAVHAEGEEHETPLKKSPCA